jgi:hypothetical protein
MKNILIDLYYGKLGEAEKNISHLYNTPEFKRYEELENQLEKTFNKEQQALFYSYCEARSLFYSKIYEYTYSNGVKTGMCLGLELVDFEPSSNNF